MPQRLRSVRTDSASNFSFTTDWSAAGSLNAPTQVSGTFPTNLPTGIGTALLYFDINNPGPTVTFNQTPAITVTTTGSFPGNACGFAVYSNNGGSGLTWTGMTNFGIAEVAPSGNSFTVAAHALPTGNNVQFSTGDQLIAVYCHNPAA